MANRKKDKKLVRVTLSVDPDDYAAMDVLAKKTSLSTARLVRQAMREFLEKYQTESSLMIELNDRL